MRFSGLGFAGVWLGLSCVMGVRAAGSLIAPICLATTPQMPAAMTSAIFQEQEEAEGRANAQ